MMKLYDAKEGMRYVVSKGTRCGTLQKGDRIRIEKGDLICNQAGGWLPEGEWSTLKAEIVPIGGFVDGSGI